MDVEGPSAEMQGSLGQHHGGDGDRQINRKDFGLNWNVALESGGLLVGDDIKIEMNVELIKVEAPWPPRPPEACPQAPVLSFEF